MDWEAKAALEGIFGRAATKIRAGGAARGVDLGGIEESENVTR